MEIYLKQSLGCVYKNLTIMDYKLYWYYNEGQTLVADHPYCTYSQVSQGYFIEGLFFSALVALLIGIMYRKHPGTVPFMGLVFFSGLGGVLLTGLINVSIMAFPIVVLLLGTLLAMAMLYYIGRYASSPVALWREHQSNKQKLAERKLKETQAELARLRAKDPYLDQELKSLDHITTALYD